VNGRKHAIFDKKGNAACGCSDSLRSLLSVFPVQQMLRKKGRRFAAARQNPLLFRAY